MAADSESKLQLVHRHIRAFPDFPKKGIMFRDICPILKDPAALTAVIDLFEEHVRKNHQQVDLIVGLDARGFLFGPLLAQRLGVGFVLVRKKGKLPGTTVSVTYELEYGKDVIILECQSLLQSKVVCTGMDMFCSLKDLSAEAEIQEDAVAPGQRVLLIDDLLATGGTLYAACELMRKQQAVILGCMVVIELKELNGIDKLKSHSVFSLVQY